MLSKQAKIAGEQNSPISNMATIFAKNVCETLSNNMKLMLINAETNTALNLQAKKFFFYPKIQSMAAMYL